MASFPLARIAEFRAMTLPLQGRKVASVCNLPSGGGYLAAQLPPSWRYTAVEPTDAFAALCQLGDGQELLRCPLTAVPKPDSSFDAVISLAGLHHEQDKLAILREIARLLRPGGTAVVADIAVGTNEDRFLNGFVNANSQLGHCGEFLDGDFAPMVERSGLEVVSDELVSTPWHFDSREQAAVFATNLFGISAPIDDVQNALGSILGFEQPNGAIALSWSLRRLVCARLPREAA